MVTMSEASPAATAAALNPNETKKSSSSSSSCGSGSGYEKCREERIKENMERMQKLGIFDLSLKLKSFNNNHPSATPRNRKNTPSIRKTPPLPPSGPTRRSSRLVNSTPVSYAENPLSKKDSSLKSDKWCLEEGSRPEIYTEEHEKLLGDTSMSWTLFVDGYGKDGKRIYDPVRGKTCHQCRQKTLGQRTHCSQCNMVQGQFCGDCLYMRYGENVVEANQNPNWICPVCRGICNCSLCRHAKGWAPTGTLYKKITNLGFKSVAHYLVQTQRSNDSVEKNLDTKVPVSAKRSLPFPDKAKFSEKAEPEDKKTNEDDPKVDQEEFLNSSSEHNKGEKNYDVESDSKVDLENNSGINKDNLIVVSNCEGDDNRNNELGISCPGSKKRSRNVVNEVTIDSIAGRLRQGQGKGLELGKVVELVASSLNSPQVGSIGGRLRQRRKCT